ncbi:MAG TPA: AAA family ATPase [Methylomirabilota bacterium]
MTGDREGPSLIFVAGPNGAGKSTFFAEYVEPLGLPYVNADELARRLREADPDATRDDIDRRAFREAERLRAALLEAGVSFATETVFSDPAGAKLRFLQTARRRGFATSLVFVCLESVALSIARVHQRTRQGGHDIPDAKLRARYPRTLANLRAAIPIVDEAFLFDNSSFDTPYRIVAVYRRGRLLSRHPPLPAWTRGLPGVS